MTPDKINATFEMLGGCFLWLSVRALYRARGFKGVHWAQMTLYTLWGAFNLWFYPAIGQWWSFAFGINVFLANFTWAIMAIYFHMKAKKEGKL